MRGKLLSDNDITKPPEQYTELGRLAVVDVRLSIEYEPLVEGNKSMHYQAQLIASHMRIAYSVPAHREYFRSGYPSEPILAEVCEPAHPLVLEIIYIGVLIIFASDFKAAARQLNVWRTGKPMPFLHILHEHMRSGLLDRGERGELVARMLVTEAYDRAVLAEEGPSNFSRGCSVVGWIKKLFQENVASAILNSRPADCKGEPFKDVFKDARLRFTHFAKTADDHIIDTHAMFAAFARGMAFTCRNGETAVDFILPVLLNKSAKLSSWVMTAVFVQVKRRTKRGRYFINAEALKFFHKEPADQLSPDVRPYITLIMDLGIQPELPEYADLAAINVLKKEGAGPKRSIPQTSTTFTKDHRTPPSPSKLDTSSHHSRRKSPRDRPVAGKHPCYQAHISGCSNTMYKVIEIADRPTYTDLLRIDEFLYEHPRPETIPEVMNLKPMFAVGKNSYRWVESDVLNPEEAESTSTSKSAEERFWVLEYDEQQVPDSDPN